MCGVDHVSKVDSQHLVRFAAAQQTFPPTHRAALITFGNEPACSAAVERGNAAITVARVLYNSTLNNL